MIKYESKFCGKTFEIAEVFSNCYKVKELSAKTFDWTDEMIEGLYQRIGEGTRSFAEGQQSHTKPSSELYKEYMEEKTKLGTASNPVEPKSNANCITRERVDELATKIDEDLPSGNQNVWELPDGYQFVDENGNVINATTISLEKKKKEYPKTYEECLMLALQGAGYNRALLLTKLEKLLTCRDAYWKLYGEEMGLGKPWGPDFTNDKELKYCIGVSEGKIQGFCCSVAQYILTFPTEEMRDAFYENFKELIEECKELL